MPRSIPSFMDDARRLVAANRLLDATALIQARLGGSPTDTAAASPQPFQGPTIELRAERVERGQQEAPTDAPPRSRPRFPRPGVATARSNSNRPTLMVPTGAEFLHLKHEGPSGARRYRLYVPSTLASGPRPLIVMLHGCTQDPEDFALGTRMNQLAEERNVLVAYPEQVRAANPSLCWNWFEPAHQRRDAGEPAIIAGITEDIARRHSVDRTRIFVAGLSAGGAMAAVLGATYADVFTGVGIHSGLPYGSAANVASALSVMRSGRQSGGGSRRRVRTIVFHGARDTTVHPANGECLAGLQQVGTNRTTTQGGSVNGRDYIRSVMAATHEEPDVEHWRVEGLGHAWSGGDANGSYADAAGPDASREMLRFFLDELQ
ncbi:PHB depolymerase family esterase [Aureimonas sp. AU4]|uniref:extracellular catalytic domain type 1 short-chain-length polyhydroxyalkanoate depolymerase n=1 Tax=Aureimonas sp. AU4 TaxID=1638163 RepID=UPI000A5D47A1|nr:PHB depolymerase family esterase [Aureimonas sp. AU4]